MDTYTIVQTTAAPVNLNGQPPDSLSLSIGTYSATPSSLWAVTEYKDAAYIEVRPILQPTSSRKRVGGGSKAAIKQFTDRSRCNLRKQLFTLNDEMVRTGKYLTLSYGGDMPTPAESKRHLEMIIKRLKYKYPNIGIIWRLGYQKRLAPHYHLLILGVRQIDASWMRSAWSDVIKSRNTSQGIHIGRVRSAAASRWYHARWEKTPVPSNHSGRWWGKAGALELYRAKPERTIITGDVAMRLREIVDEHKFERVMKWGSPARKAWAIENKDKQRFGLHAFHLIGRAPILTQTLQNMDKHGAGTLNKTPDYITRGWSGSMLSNIGSYRN